MVKHVSVLLVTAFSLCLVTGCATQSVEQTDIDGRTTRYRTTAFFNKTAMTGTLLSKETKATKQLFGQAGSSAETQTESITAFFEGMNSLVETAIKTGIKGAATGGTAP